MQLYIKQYRIQLSQETSNFTVFRHKTSPTCILLINYEGLTNNDNLEKQIGITVFFGSFKTEINKFEITIMYALLSFQLLCSDLLTGVVVFSFSNDKGIVVVRLTPTDVFCLPLVDFMFPQLIHYLRQSHFEYIQIAMLYLFIKLKLS